MPNRPRSLLGLARASAMVGDRGKAIEAYTNLTKVWAGRDSFDAYKEAMDYLHSTEHN